MKAIYRTFILLFLSVCYACTDENIPTVDKLKALAELEYKNNKVDMPKQNFKIEFIPLSKCVGYEGLEDNISLCDTVAIFCISPIDL